MYTCWWVQNKPFTNLISNVTFLKREKIKTNPFIAYSEIHLHDEICSTGILEEI
jgi:hypothetical protein